MILQSLNDYYHRKCADPDPRERLPDFGFEQKEIPFVLEIALDGTPVQLIDTRTANDKKKLIARSYIVPQSVKRASNIAANLLFFDVRRCLALVWLVVFNPVAGKRTRDCTCSSGHGTTATAADLIAEQATGQTTDDCATNTALLWLLLLLALHLHYFVAAFLAWLIELFDLWRNAYDSAEIIEIGCISDGKAAQGKKRHHCVALDRHGKTLK